MSLGYISGSLPQEWETPFLKDMVYPKQWKTISVKDLTPSGYTVYGANGKIGFYSEYTHENPTIMLTCRGATCGNIHISEPFSYINGNAMALDNQPINLIGLHFLKYALQARGLEDTISGSAQPQITGQGLEKVQVPLPPRAEQKIIAEKLDTLLAQVESTKARLEQIPQILKRFRQAVLAAAVSGKLTNRPDQNRHWKELLLSDIASHIVDCPHSTPKWSSEGKYCVRTTAFTPFNLDLSKQGFVDEKTYQDRIQRLKPEADDILYSREGTIGIACQIPKGVELCLGQRMVLIRASDKISSKYLTIVLNSNKILKIVKSKTMGSTAPRINMADIKSYPISLPPLPEQHEIVRRVEQLFAYADTIEKQANNALARVNNLTQSILAKAFRGELTAQWRAENPDLISGENSAAALLEKIKAERAASGGKKASRKKS